MIDIKAVRAAAEEAVEQGAHAGAVVITLCDEIERLRKEVEADERNLCQLTDELAVFTTVLRMALGEIERSEAIMLRECGIGVVNRLTIAAIKELL